MPPAVPINHHLAIIPVNQQNGTEVHFHYSMHYSFKAVKACVKHSNFLTVNRGPQHRQLGEEHPRIGPLLPGKITRPRSFVRRRCPPTIRDPTRSILNAAILIYAIGAGITAAAGTRLALQWHSLRGLNCSHSNYQKYKKFSIVIYCHYLPVSGLGNLRACCLPWMW